MSSEEQKLNEWFNCERVKDLVDFKVRVSDTAKGLTREQLCKDINTMIDNIAAGKTHKIDWKKLEAEIGD